MVLWTKSQAPSVEVVMSNKDSAGAFRLLWVDPGDVEIFAGDLPWIPGKMAEGGDLPGEFVRLLRGQRGARLPEWQRGAVLVSSDATLRS